MNGIDPSNGPHDRNDLFLMHVDNAQDLCLLESTNHVADHRRQSGIFEDDGFRSSISESVLLPPLGFSEHSGMQDFTASPSRISLASKLALLRGQVSAPSLYAALPLAGTDAAPAI